MVAEAVAGAQIFTQLLNTAKGLIEIRDATLRDQAVFTLQRDILAAQAAQMALVQEVGDLKAQIARFEDWDAEKQRYELVDAGNGGLAYRVKDAMKGSQPDHHICANCYERRTKSILHPETWNPGRAHVLSCHTCGTAVYLHGMPFPDHAALRQKAR